MCWEVDDTACSLHVARCLHDLVELNISSCTSITDAGVASILKSLRKLQRLDISGCRVGDDFLPAVKLSLRLQQQQIRPQLRELQMKYCVAISDRALERIAILLPNLRTLCLASCKRISDEGIEYLGSQRRRRLPHLQTLDLSHCERITNGGACSLLEEHDRGDDNDNDNDNDDDDRTAKSSPQLQSLSLSACTQISRLSALRCSSSCSSIVSLVLSDCIDITDECLCDLTLLSQLRQLRLDGCTRITDAGFCHLIPFLLCLCDLDLTGCLLLTDASVVAISLSCLLLRSLVLSHCNLVTDASVVALSDSLSVLESQQLIDCLGITDAALHYVASTREGTNTPKDCSSFSERSSSTLRLPLLKCLDVTQCSNETREGVLAVRGSHPLAIVWG